MAEQSSEEDTVGNSRNLFGNTEAKPNIDELPEVDLNFGDLDLTSQDENVLDELDEFIQKNLEDSLVKEALNKGVDLRQYSKQIESDLRKVENESVHDYYRESKNIASLHQQIKACDGILETMENMLSSFQVDLRSISSEIQTLQEQSLSMNIKLKNRQAIKGELSQFIDEMIVPESMILAINDLEPTEQTFIEQLHELSHKINVVKQQSFKGAMACNDVRDVLDKLRLKAVSKIREFILQRVYQCRKPMSNYQVPQNALLKYRYFFEFLLAHHRQVAREIRDEYVDTMSKIYSAYFGGYIAKLMKLQYEELAGKDDLMGVEDTAKTRGFFSTKTPLRNRSTIFSLGSRGQVITDLLEEPIIVPHAAQKTEKRYSFEALFRSQHFALLDNACREYLFLCDFFLVSGNQASELFVSVFGKVVTFFMKHMSSYVVTCFDGIAVFLCIHIIHRYKIIMLKRDVPALEKYWDTLLDMLWPRFMKIIEMNTSSVKQTDPQKLGNIDVQPHYITRRYAEFSGAINSLNESFPDERVLKCLSNLQREVENFILRRASEFVKRKDHLVFLINNYDMMLQVISERTNDDSKESDSFQQTKNTKTQEYVEEVLTPYFGGMMSFVKETEPMLEKGQANYIRVNEGRVEQLIRDFAVNWKVAIENMNQEVMRSFSNFKNGTNILQAALTQLIQYYHRFQKVLSQPPFNRLSCRSDLINIHHVMVEAKKHKTTF
ncbi:vacuolar protein sorting-associated protein 52 homolog [Hydractinia symbiolongicarpus]|uniref:vacuolar protein sorting-associated protein 52 homolog n=1 Tax=Hydractinia symbiolongicarpus TaxID=13093 RepID=UPI00254F82E1|nr:vacuolar protein sorting-associated protein 52 homolog [Hydractinia symbiolongicarpus]